MGLVMKNFILNFLLIWFCLVPPSIAGKGAEDLKYMTESLPPYSYEDEGELTGFSVELLKLIWQELGVKEQRINMMPWARAYLKLGTEENTVLFTISRAAHREHLFKWVCPITLGSKHVFLAKKDRHITISSLEDSKKYRIGTVRDDVLEQLMLKKGFALKDFSRVTNIIQNVKKLNLNRIDLIAQNETSILDVITEHGYNPNSYESVFVIMQVQSCYAFNKNVDDKIIFQFKNALNKVRLSNEFNVLKKTFSIE